MNLLEIRGLTRVFPDGTRALDGVDLSLEAGSFTVLAGPNGSGKTQLARHAAGLQKPTAGSVFFRGTDIRQMKGALGTRIGLVFQDADAQLVGSTAAKDIAFGPENLRLPREEIDRRVAEALERLGLAHLKDHRPHTLSGGEKRRLAIAGVLAMDPELIILDEPFTGLDWPGVRQALDRIVDLHRRGHTLLVITHDLEKVLAHADRLVLMDRGRIGPDGSPSDILPVVADYGIRPPWGDARPLESLTWST